MSINHELFDTKQKNLNEIQTDSNELNKELEAKGYHTVTGRVSRKYFEESYYGVIPEKEAV